jgi:hypothetical protein
MHDWFGSEQEEDMIGEVHEKDMIGEVHKNWTWLVGFRIIGHDWRSSKQQDMIGGVEDNWTLLSY